MLEEINDYRSTGYHADIPNHAFATGTNADAEPYTEIKI